MSPCVIAGVVTEIVNYTSKNRGLWGNKVHKGILAVVACSMTLLDIPNCAIIILLGCTALFWHGVFSSWLYVKSYVELDEKKINVLTMEEVIFS